MQGEGRKEVAWDIHQDFWLRSTPALSNANQRFAPSIFIFIFIFFYQLGHLISPQILKPELALLALKLLASPKPQLLHP